jgi:hypothetical protein
MESLSFFGIARISAEGRLKTSQIALREIDFIYAQDHLVLHS